MSDPTPASPMSDERLAEICGDWKQLEPGFYARDAARAALSPEARDRG